MPVPALAQVARDVRDAKREQKRTSNPVRKAARKVAVLFAMMFAVLGFGGGVAQAWPWDVVNDIQAFITNFCGPENVPTPVDHTGVDTLFGLNTTYSELRSTALPPVSTVHEYATWSGTGLERIQGAYPNTPGLIHPTYERYGFSTLTWGNYGAGCFSLGYWFTPVANFALQVFVILPTIVGMFSLELAMGPILSTVFGAIIQPFVSMFSAIFTPWIFFIAPLGVLWVWITKRSTQAVLKAAVWVIAIYGVFLWIGNNTSEFVVKANNLVTEIAGSAANAINAANQGIGADGTDAISDGNGVASTSALGAIKQSIWYGLPYQAWLEGQVGPAQASADRALEQAGSLGWGPVILNSMYAGDDQAGKDLRTAVNHWNALSYATGREDTKKTGYWTGANGGWFGLGEGTAAWADIPYLFNIKAMCNDQATDGEGSGDAELNRWMLGGSNNCDAATAGTSSMIPYFTGDAYNQRLITAVAGGVGAYANSITISGVSWYLAAQKMMFYFLILFAPIFLAISTFADDKRRRFATQFFSVAAGNVIKQAVAVMVLLFIANAMSLLLYPPANQPAFALLREIAWPLKPAIAVLFFIALLLFAIPMRKIITAAAKGDASIVKKTADAPVNAAKTTAKVAAVAGAAIATGGVAALAAGGVASAGGVAALAGKSAGMLGTAGRALAGTKAAGLGKVLTSAGRLSQMGGQMNGMLANRNMTGEVVKAGVAAMTGASGKVTPESQAYMAKMAATPGMVGPDGKLTAAGEAQAKKDFITKAQAGAQAGQAEAMKKNMMAGMFASYREEHNGEYHSLDPQNPVNIEQAKVAQAQENQRIKDIAAGKRNREEALDPSSADASAPADSPAQASPRNPRPGSDSTPAEAAPADAQPQQGEPRPRQAHDAIRPDGGAVPVDASGEAITDDISRTFAEQASMNVVGPAFARNPDIKATVELRGEDVLSTVGLTAVEAMESPARIVAGGAYGDLSTMDPQHPATPALNELRFALTQGTADDVMDAELRVQSIIGSHGLPDQIKTIGVTGESARAFEPTEVVAAMPNLTLDTSWQERADAASMMNAVSATIPQGAPAGEAMQRYVSALGDPSVDIALVEAAQVQAMQALRDMQIEQQAGVGVFAGGFDAVAAVGTPAFTESAPAPIASEPAPTFRTYEGFADSGVTPRGMEDLYSEAPPTAQPSYTPAPAPQEAAPVYETPVYEAPQVAQPSYTPAPQDPLYDTWDAPAEDAPRRDLRQPEENRGEHYTPAPRPQEGLTREDIRDAFRDAAESGYIGASGGGAGQGSGAQEAPSVPAGPRSEAPAVSYSEDVPEATAPASRRERRDRDDDVPQFNQTKKKRSSGLFGDDVDGDGN